jgi:histidinol phosphatase-like PHP family hydrolase
MKKAINSIKDMSKSDLHMHSLYSDGKCEISLLARSAAFKGLEAIAITDHLYEEVFPDGSGVEKYFADIDACGGAYPDLKIIKGVEGTLLDIDGEISISQENAKRFELVLVDMAWKTAGIAVNPPGNEREFKRNVSLAFKNLSLNENVNIIAHPFNFGRLIPNFVFSWLSCDLLEEIAGYLIAGNKRFEIMEGIWWWFPGLSPHEFTSEYSRILSVFKRCGVKFSKGSDSHSHQGVGNALYTDALIEEISRDGSGFSWN